MAVQPQPLVSVLTPIYNGAEHLRECIESVLGQTHQHWEHILVNNCSNDSSLEIAREFAARDSRIRVHDNVEFVRVIQNYNIAFRQISVRSQYCKVVGADDWIFPECLQRMVHVAEMNPTVGIVGAYGLHGTRVVWDGLPHFTTVVSGREICRSRLLGGPYIFGTPTALLFRSDLVRSRQSFFNESNFHADTEICFDLLRHCDFGFVHQVLTFNRIHDESLTSFSKRLNTYQAGFLNDLVRYGPFYLSPIEMQQRLRHHLRNYYRFLARMAFRDRSKRFWSFHCGKLREQGCPINWFRLGGEVLLALVDRMLNPKLTIEGLFRLARKP